MQEFDMPIFKKVYELYKIFCELRRHSSRLDRYTIWQKSDSIMLEIIEGILEASQKFKGEKLPILEKTSVKLNFLRIFFRLMKDTESIDLREYAQMEEIVDEIGKMLGGWIRSTKNQL